MAVTEFRVVKEALGRVGEPITTFAVAGSAAVVAAHQPGAAPGSGAHIATRTFIGQGGSADGVSLMSVCLC